MPSASAEGGVSPSRFETYSLIDGGLGEAAPIRGEADARSLIERARREGRSLTFRAAAESLHDQAVGELVGLLSLPSSLRREGQALIAGAGATWASVMQEALPAGFAPPVVPTTALATLGGTLSADCLCQLSPTYGKERAGVRWVKVLTADGVVRTLSRPSESTSAADDALFHGVVGGLGTLGLVLEVSHALLPLPFDGPACVHTDLTTTRSVSDLIRALAEDPHRDRGAPSGALWHGHRDLSAPSTWAAMDLSGRGFVLRKRFAPDDRPAPPFFVYSPDSAAVVAANWAACVPKLTQWAWQLIYARHSGRQGLYRNPWWESTFFMEGQRRARALAMRAGVRLAIPQQSFVLPMPEADAAGPSERFWEAFARELRDRHLEPSAIDLLTLPADEGPLSASRGQAGMVWTASFQRLDGPSVERVKDAMRALSRLCASLGGRVHLVKNVFAEPDVVQEMYKEGLQEWRRLKDLWDPEGVFGSAFTRRLLGNAVGERRG